MIYLFDTNAITATMAEDEKLYSRITIWRSRGDKLAICHPVYYEVLRGLLWKNATTKLKVFQQQVLPMFEWIELTESDWERAAHFWAEARTIGRQLGDPDLLLAAIAFRLGATIVSADNDFDAFSIARENWRV